MAQHIQSVAASGIPQVTKDQLYKLILPGDLLFCAGRTAIDGAIQGLTASPWSHVLRMWLADPSSPWLTIEATFTKGVHIGLLDDYINGYVGDLVVARRPTLSDRVQFDELNRGLSLLDDHYDWQQEVSIAARKLVKQLPLIEPKGELYCSGLQYAMSLAGPYPLQRPAENYPTPEDNWTDSRVMPVCALLRPAEAK